MRMGIRVNHTECRKQPDSQSSPRNKYFYRFFSDVRAEFQKSGELVVGVFSVGDMLLYAGAIASKIC